MNDPKTNADTNSAKVTIENFKNNNIKHQEHQTDCKPLKLKVVITTVAQKKKSTSPSRSRAPIMGRSALLKKTNAESSDSLIIHDLITDKYGDVLNQYYSRKYRRSLSKQESWEDKSAGTTPTSSSPTSISSISTANTSYPDEKNGFIFPVENVHELLVPNYASIETIEDFEVTSVDSEEVTNSSRAGSCHDVLEEDRESQGKIDDHKMTNSDLSTLLSKAACLYASMMNIARCSFKSTATIPEELGSCNRLSGTSDNVRLENLKTALSMQTAITFQVSKALHCCKMTRTFKASVEFIEAQRILLVALCTKKALTKEIQYLEDDTYETKDDHRSCGEVEISNLKFPGKNTNKTDPSVRRDFTEHFLIILTSADTVLASDVVTADEHGNVNINKCFRFTNLPTDFDISVCIYAMRIGNKLQEQEGKSNCPSLKKIFFQKHSEKYKVLGPVSHIKPSLFTLWGKCEIRSPELSKTKSEGFDGLTLKMFNTPLSSSLSGMLSMSIKSDVKLFNRVSGFLTLGVDSKQRCTIWNRRWCVLQGSILEYWNCPSEEIASSMGHIDLCDCIEQRINLADRGIYGRPRTLMLTIQDDRTMKRYLLSADNSSDFNMWEMELNYVIFALRVWKRINLSGADVNRHSKQ